MKIIIILIISNLRVESLSRDVESPPLMRISRRKVNSVKLYSLQGRHLTINHNGKIGSTLRSSSSLSELLLIPTGSNEFIIQGEMTGLYVSTSGLNNNLKLRLRGSLDPNKAARFEEEIINYNFFNKYKLKNKNCFIKMKNSGKIEINCKNEKKNKYFSFLPRKVHSGRKYTNCTGINCKNYHGNKY